jgi:hypothetical protein
MTRVLLKMDHLPSDLASTRTPTWAGHLLAAQVAAPLVTTSIRDATYRLVALGAVERLDARRWTLTFRDIEGTPDAARVALESWCRIRERIGTEPFRFLRRARKTGRNTLELTCRWPVPEIEPYLDSPFLWPDLGRLSRLGLVRRPWHGRDRVTWTHRGLVTTALACRHETHRRDQQRGWDVRHGGLPGLGPGNADSYAIDVFFTVVPSPDLEPSQAQALGEILPLLSRTCHEGSLLSSHTGLQPGGTTRIAETFEKPMRRDEDSKTIGYTPYSPNYEVATAISEAFQAVTGERLAPTERPYVEAYDDKYHDTARLALLAPWNSHPATVVRMLLSAAIKNLTPENRAGIETRLDRLESRWGFAAEESNAELASVEVDLARKSGVGRLGRYIGDFHGFDASDIPRNGFARQSERESA